MAFQFCTGYDFYTTASQIWDTVAGTVTINSASARFGGTHSQGASYPASASTQKNLVGNQPTVIVGWAIKTLANPGSTSPILYLLDNTTTVQVSLAITAAGALQFYRGAPSGNPIGSAGSTNFAAGVWHYLEVKATIDPSAGVAQCWLDGVQVINGSSLNTRNNANSYANQFRIGELAGGITGGVTCDDVYCLDGTGGSLNAALGDRRIITIMPSGAGSFTQFTPVGAASNYQCVDEVPANDNTDYVSDGTVNHRDSYVYESVAISGNADFIVPWARISKDDASAHTVELSATDTANDAFSSAIAVPSSYGYVNGGAFATSPNGAAAWSQTVINRTEWGIKVIS
jgi:hypothetical protein